MDRVRAWWQRRRVRISAVVLSVSLVLIGGSYAIMRQTDSVSVQTQVWNIAHDGNAFFFKRQPDTVVETVIHASATASRVRAIFDTARPIPWGAKFMCGLPGNQIITYDFVFTWRGIPTESIHWSLDGCSFISITQWGVPPTWSYLGLFPEQYHEVVQLTGVPAALNH